MLFHEYCILLSNPSSKFHSRWYQTYFIWYTIKSTLFLVQPRLRDIHFWMLMMKTWVANAEITIFIKTEPLSQLCSCPCERPAIRTDLSFGIWVGGMHLIFEKKRKPVNVLPRCVITSRPPSDTNRQEGGKAPKSQSKNSITPSFVYYAHRPQMRRSIKSDHTKTGAHSNMVNINGRLWMEEEQWES